MAMPVTAKSTLQAPVLLGFSDACSTPTPTRTMPSSVSVPSLIVWVNQPTPPKPALQGEPP